MLLHDLITALAAITGRRLVQHYRGGCGVDSFLVEPLGFLMLRQDDYHCRREAGIKLILGRGLQSKDYLACGSMESAMGFLEDYLGKATAAAARISAEM